MRITVHSAPTQQRFAIALTLTQKWLTTKTAADVVRLFVKRFDAKHGSKTTDAFGLAVRSGDAIAPDQPLGAALGSSTDLELRRVESSDDALAKLRKLETMEESAISKAYRALARGEGDGLVRDLSRVDATTLDAALQQNHEEFGDEWQAQFGNVLSGHCRHDVKLDLSDANVRAALAALLSTIEPTIAASFSTSSRWCDVRLNAPVR